MMLVSTTLVGVLFGATAVVLNYVVWYMLARTGVVAAVSQARAAADLGAPGAAALGVLLGTCAAWLFFSARRRLGDYHCELLSLPERG